MATLLGMGLLSAAALVLQVALTRVFSIAQFYHFAFLVISLALLGFGASGSLLVLWPGLRRPERGAWHALGFALSSVAAYLFVNLLPFDSYSIAWDRAQVALLAANLLALAVPFAFAGALIAALLSAEAARAGRIYSANLVGSAAGAALAPLLIGALGSERAVLLGAALGAVAALVLVERGRRALRTASWGSLAAILLLMVALPDPLQIHPSPYKRLSQFRLNPDATIVATRQNAYARLDIVASPTIHSAPGLSLTYLGGLPSQIGLLIDGDVLLPVMETHGAPLALARALPTAPAYALRPGASVVVLGSGGNMETWAALVNGARAVTVVEPNRLVYDALTDDLRGVAGIAGYPHVDILHREIRTFAQERPARYDIAVLTLADNYRPITSGAFTLTENYTLTVEAFRAYLDLLNPDGLLVFSRWLQSPPSETPRALALVLEALADRVPDPRDHIFVFRSFQTATFLVKPMPFTMAEVKALLDAIERLRYDLVLAPDMPDLAERMAGLVNRFARLETPIYHETLTTLADAPDRAAFYAAYDFDIRPPTDDHPFFFHFFRWRQTPEVLQNLGTRWQPFGGSGFFVLLALLIFAAVAALLFVLVPVALRSRFREALRGAGRGRAPRVAVYFAAIGLAYLLVEVALIQTYMLTLGQPTLAVAVVIGALLLWSGVGSARLGQRAGRWWIAALAVIIALTPLIVRLLTPLLLPLPLALRVAAVIALIAPPGLLMGVPFPRGIAALRGTPALVPWAWAVNGGASVISAVLAVIVALSWGFTVVLLCGGVLYLLAAILADSGKEGEG
ncbi:MAG: hypothetical protein HPY64_12860 [Anaerolineae bacterium]|nr:hypothetical protein [Anaerolineae bacterium]